MPNAADYEGGRKRILAVGAGGSGKTTLIHTLPGKKFVYMFDPSGMESLQGNKTIDYEEFCEDNLSTNVVALKAGVQDVNLKKTEPVMYREWEQHFMDAITDGFFDQYDWLCFDSMTTFQDMVMDRVLWLNNRQGKWPEQADWTSAMNTTIRVLRKLTSLQKPVLVTAHVDLAQEYENGPMVQKLNLVGKLRMRAPLLFSDVWFCKADRDVKGNPEWIVQTVGDRRTPFVRCSFKGLANEEVMNIDDWNDPSQFGVGAFLRDEKKAA